MNLHFLWYETRANIWWRPLAWSVAAVLLAFALLQLDQEMAYRGLTDVSPWLFVDSADGARTLLGAVATAMLTVATLAFSILMIAVVQTANAYSPRVLREYLSDAGNQHVLGILLGVFLYTLVVLRRVEETPERTFLPMLSVSAAVVLSLLAVLAFIYFINHVAHSIEVGSIIDRISEEAADLIDALFPSTVGVEWVGEKPPALPPGTGKVIYTREAGYLEAVAGEALMEALVEADAVLRLERTIGDFLFREIPLATLWTPEPAGEELVETIVDSVNITNERSTVQDLHFGLKQLNDIALRALSPAINDPRTAVHCVYVLGDLLSELGRRPRVSHYRCDEEGDLRLIAHGPTFVTALDSAYLELMPYIVTDSLATAQLLEVYAALANAVHHEQDRDKLWQHLWRVAFSLRQTVTAPWDKTELNRRLEVAADALGRPAEGLLLRLEMPEAYIAGKEAE
ncbi:MAG: DUF2254 domain-containing protein [Candidatus Promineifilaceae bacterium]|nr:DUF2254 domain-containing protein [Candidatus Promineifilaceae bacterium]